jgi:hypothetical protein
MTLPRVEGDSAEPWLARHPDELPGGVGAGVERHDSLICADVGDRPETG